MDSDDQFLSLAYTVVTGVRASIEDGSIVFVLAALWILGTVIERRRSH